MTPSTDRTPLKAGRALMWDCLLPAAAFSCFAALAIPLLNRVEPNWEEACDIWITRGMLERAHSWASGRLPLGQLQLPLVWTRYHGAGEFYAAIPFVLALGPTEAALKAQALVCAAFIVWGTYRMALAASGSRTSAGIAALLLATMPHFILGAAQSVLLGYAETALSVWAIVFFMSYLERWEPLHGCAAAALMGAALACRSNVAALCLGLGFGVVAERSRRRELRQRVRPRHAAAFAVLFLLPQVPYAWTILSDPAAVAGIAARAGRVAGSLSYLGGLGERCRELWSILLGTAELHALTAPERWLPGAAGLAALMLTGLIAPFREKEHGLRRLLAVAVVAYLLLSVLVPTRLRPDQMTEVIPILCVLAAAVPLPRASLLRGGVMAAGALLLLGQALDAFEFSGAVGGALRRSDGAGLTASLTRGEISVMSDGLSGLGIRNVCVVGEDASLAAMELSLRMGPAISATGVEPEALFRQSRDERPWRPYVDPAAAIVLITADDRKRAFLAREVEGEARAKKLEAVRAREPVAVGDKSIEFYRFRAAARER